MRSRSGREKLLELRNIVAGYGAGDVLRRLDLHVARGSITCIVGPNGAGKSTVLRLVSGLLRAERGSIRLADEEIGRLSPAEILDLGVAQVPQSHGVFPSMTVRENVLLGGYVIRRDRALVARRFAAVEELFPIVAERADDNAGNLSGGQQRMVEFARSLMLDPQLVMLDEPSAGLDPIAVKHVADSIETMKQAGKTLLIVEQNVRFGLMYASDGIMMEAGRVAAHEPAADLLRRPEIARFLFGGGIREQAENGAPL